MLTLDQPDASKKIYTENLVMNSKLGQELKSTIRKIRELYPIISRKASWQGIFLRGEKPKTLTLANWGVGDKSFSLDKRNKVGPV